MKSKGHIYRLVHKSGRSLELYLKFFSDCNMYILQFFPYHTIEALKCYQILIFTVYIVWLIQLWNLRIIFKDNHRSINKPRLEAKLDGHTKKPFHIILLSKLLVIINFYITPILAKFTFNISTKLLIINYYLKILLLHCILKLLFFENLLK